MTENIARTYPVTRRLRDVAVTLQPMAEGDRDVVVEFARALPAHDLLFLRRDIRRPEVVDTWLSEIYNGTVTTILATIDNTLAGYATIHRETLQWSSHVAELRVVVGERARGQGLGRLLTQEAFANALARGIEKMVARMTVDQKGAIATFEGLGFRPEALLRDHVKDLEGDKHDLILMSHDVEEFQRALDSYGVTDALGG